jgi:hypothetical protein
MRAMNAEQREIRERLHWQEQQAKRRHAVLRKEHRAEREAFLAVIDRFDRVDGGTAGA